MPRTTALLLALILLAPACLRAQATEKLAATAQPFVDRHELAGAVMLVADREKILATETVGWADIAAQKAMQAGSMFWIASQSKPVSPTTFGHGGAYSTNSVADTQYGLIRIWLVQHASLPGEGGKAQGVFMKAAVDEFGGAEK